MTLAVEQALVGSAREHLAVFLPCVMRTDAGRPAFPPRHLRQVIAAVEDDSLGNTVIIAPPGSAKTNTMIGAAGWWLGQDPNRHIGYISNTAAQAYRRSVAVRDLVERHGNYGAIFPRVQPDKLKGWAESEWYVSRPDVADKDASFTAAGVGGPILGARFDRAILDDIADAENMATALQRDKVIDWLSKTLLSRMTPDGRIVMICTRWHESDPAAWAIARGWHVVHVDAVDEEGESYWPERWPAPVLACPGEHVDPPKCCIKASLGTRDFNLMYQGLVADDESALFKRTWWKTYRREDIAHRWAMGELRGASYVDTAQTTKETSDYSVIATWLTDGARSYLWNLRRGRWTFTELMQQCIEAQREAKGAPIVIEETPWSLSLIDALRVGIDRDTPGVAGVVPFKITRYSEQTKYNRAKAASPFCEAGSLFVPMGAGWVQDFVEEHAVFPSGAHDDQVDTTSMMVLRELMQGQVFVGTYA